PGCGRSRHPSRRALRPRARSRGPGRSRRLSRRSPARVTASLPPVVHTRGKTRYASDMLPEVGITGLIVILIVALLVFGPKRLPEIGRSLGKGMREFKDSITGNSDDKAELRPAPGTSRLRLRRRSAVSRLPRRLRHGEEATVVGHLGE